MAQETSGYLAGVNLEGEDFLISPHFLCRSCAITALNALELGRQVTQVAQKGGRQLYIAVERTGQESVLLSAKRWSPLESLENADSVGEPLHTYQLPQE